MPRPHARQTALALTALAAILAPATTLAQTNPAPTASTTSPTAPTPASVRAGLAGVWEGTLEYRDYQSNRLVPLPVRTEIRLLPDGTEVRVSEFNEGPGRRPAYIAGLYGFDAATGTLTNTSMRAGRSQGPFTETLVRTAITSPTEWTLEFSSTGQDGSRIADVKVTRTRSGDTLTEQREVRAQGDTAAPWEFRNRTTLKRTGDIPVGRTP